MKGKAQFLGLSHIEKLNFLTHGASFALVLVTAPILLIRAFQFDDSWLVRITILGFLIATLIMFGTSTMYHFSQDAERKRQWRLADHIGIYVMIAGSYAPVLAIYFWQPKGQVIFIVMWLIALAGAVFKWFATGKYDLLSTLLYVLMGLSILTVSDDFFPLLPANVKFYLILGGLSYLVGVFFYLFKYWSYHHPVWHLFVMGGAFSHWWAVWLALT
ncbi:MAG: hemolysin III [Saprospiraceae bacterium]|jgi:hemolysin III